jgi:hypothetical protein
VYTGRKRDETVYKGGLPMAKTRYYVSVSSRTVQETLPETDNLEVDVDADELDELRSLLTSEERKDETTQLVAPIPYKSNDHAEAGQDYTDGLSNLYGYIYQVGTEETKRHIESMKILNKLQDTDYNYPGYKR